MRKGTKIGEFLYDFFDTLTTAMVSGRDMNYVLVVGREAYEATLRKQRGLKTSRNNINYLRRHDFLSIRERGDKIILELTEKGRAEFLKEKIVRTKKRLPKGEWCLVSFDIPEKTRWTRVALRGFLARAHFTQGQKSVWRSPYDVCVLMREFVSGLGAGEWIHVYRCRRLL